MRLVIDANILIAALLKDATTREILLKEETEFFAPEKSFLPFIKRSLSLVSHIEDAPYLALSWALRLPLWSNDAALKTQSLVQIYTTSELLDILH